MIRGPDNQGSKLMMVYYSYEYANVYLSKYWKTNMRGWIQYHKIIYILVFQQDIMKGILIP